MTQANFVHRLVRFILPIVLVTGVTSERVDAQITDAPPTLSTPGNTPTAYENPDLVMKYQSTITPEDLAAHLYFFASDFFEGRETTARSDRTE